MSFGKERIAGLDIGQTTTKLVVVERAGKKTRVVKTALFDHREEGLVDEQEVVEHLGAWLNEAGAMKAECRIGLPQYMAMTQVSNFPPGINGKLDEMVQYETQQLAGLTDEVFLQDYMRLQPFEGFENPVLLAVCRDSVIENKLNTLAPAEIPIEALHMEGSALCEAYLHQMPEEEKDKLVLVLDVGSENTTMGLVLKGQVIHLGSFLFGGDFFTEALAKHLGVNEMEAERVKKTSRLNVGSDDCPMAARAQGFIMELEAALDVCSTYNPQTSDLRISSIYLSGGGSLVTGFDEFLEKTYNCPVKPLTCPDVKAQRSVDDPERTDPGLFNIALGLALEGAIRRKRHEAISLTPEDVEWRSLRRKRASMPYMALALLILLCAGYLGGYYWILGKERAKLTERKAELDACTKLAEPIQESRKKIRRYQQILTPIAARGNRNIKFVKALDEVSQASGPDDWFYLVADPLAYHNQEEPMETFQYGKSKEDKRESVFKFVQDASSAPEDKRICVRAGTVKPWEGLIFSGFSASRSADRRENIKRIITTLQGGSVFEKVDTLAELSETDRQARGPWMKFGMLPFRLGCRFKDIEFDAAMEEEK